jgi:ABC-type multidrug transport system permease subunit
LARCLPSAHVPRRSVYYKHKAYHYYDGRAYFLSLLVADLPFMLLETFAFTIVAYWMAGLASANLRVS